jgi:hypothetical protein
MVLMAGLGCGAHGGAFNLKCHRTSVSLGKPNSNQCHHFDGLLFALTLSAGCRRPVPARLDPSTPVEEYCWWAVQRTVQPTSSVAARFDTAFKAVGLTTLSRTFGDTIWVSGAPARVDSASKIFSARAVAFARGDSTYYRVYASALDHISSCIHISKVAAVPTVTPREPTGEESLGVWTRHP